MFLKKIIIEGFKSFAKPVEINFHSPFTAIVGPNGSGKSNIVDAIRWTLGEQSAKTLRGSRMSDVIFAGSEDYSPLKKASVTLYFDNSDGDLPLEEKNIKIKRCVTEDGQSDYYLNGSGCRLKDIEELLMDTGLGKDSYSIVGQGKIDSVLNSKPKKLRELFEEAAGIVKYKSRKEEAERRLEKSRHDFQRVKDLIWELDKQVKPLKRSARKARKYKRLTGELKTLEVNLLLDRHENNRQELDRIRKKKGFLGDVLSNLTEKMENTRADLDGKQKQLQNHEEKIEELQENLYDAKIKKEQTENNIKVIAERRNGLKREQNNLKINLENMDEQHGDLSRKKACVQDKIDEVNNKLKKVIDELDRLQDKYENIRKETEEKEELLYNSRNLILNENEELNDLQSNLDKAKEKGRYLEKEIDKIAEKRKEISGQLDQNIIDQKELLHRMNMVQEKLDDNNDKLNTYKEEQESMEKSLRLMVEEIDDIKSTLNQTRSRLNILQDMENDYRGYFRGVKTILKSAGELEGIIGIVSNLIEVKSEYEVAIETALGSKLQNIVTEDDRSARNAIDYLKNNQGGRVTFLPLNIITGKTVDLENYHLGNIDGLLGLAPDFIDCEKRLEIVVKNLLGRTIVADDLDSAVVIAKKTESRFKIVTLDGDIMRIGGAITGGSAGARNRTGLLGRSRKIEELSEEIKMMEEDLKKKEKKINDRREEVKKLGILREEKRNEINNLQFKYNDIKKDLSTLEKEHLRLENELDSLDNDFEDYHKRLGHNDSNIQGLEKQISIITSENSREKSEISIKEEEIKKLKDEEDKINEKITKMKVQEAKMIQKKDSLLTEKENLISSINKLKQTRKENRHKSTEIDSKIEDINNKELELKEMSKDFTEKIKKYDREHDKYRKNLKKKEKEVGQLQENYDRTQSKLNDKKDEYHKIELKITRLEDKTEQIEKRLLDDYEVDVEKGIADRIEISNFAQASRKIKEFKDSIKQLGAVNVGAIKEYEELQERLENLREQREDLLTAKESINKIIKKLNNTMSKMFYETFVEVKDHFEQIFESLFNGGKAELMLSKPENLLETGVEIEAQPPGKQLKKLSLMSGGERALTAIALVFAFMKVNPSPIYILDEIDAPLDDANVLRFANYLKKNSDYVQFLLITHNKRMMTQANIIYGITMEEPGVSKLISLKIDEEEIA